MLHGENYSVHQSRSQNVSRDLRGVAGGGGKLGCLCCKAGTSHIMCDDFCPFSFVCCLSL